MEWLNKQIKFIRDNGKRIFIVIIGAIVLKYFFGFILYIYEKLFY